MSATDAEPEGTRCTDCGDAPETNEERARAIVRRYMYLSMGAGLIPAPGVDLAGISAVQLKLVHSLAQTYGVDFREDAGKSAVASLLGALGPVTLARGTFGSLVKAIPVIGTAIGLAAQPVLAGAFTHAVGKVFVQHFESGGTFLDLNPRAVRDYFAQQFQAGKLVASEMAAEKGRQSSDKTAAAPPTD